MAKRESAQARSEKTPLSWKWLSEDYARNLGSIERVLDVFNKCSEVILSY